MIDIFLSGTLVPRTHGHGSTCIDRKIFMFNSLRNNIITTLLFYLSATIIFAAKLRQSRILLIE